MTKNQLDMNNKYHRTIVGALACMVDYDGLSPHEAFEVLEDIKRQSWHGLQQIANERGATQ